MTLPTLRSPAWLLSGLTRSEPGTLMLVGGRIVFEAHGGRRVFDTAPSELSAVSFPWYYFGGGMKLRIGSASYRVSFARPGNLPDDPGAAGDVGSARRMSAAWKAALMARAPKD